MKNTIIIGIILLVAIIVISVIIYSVNKRKKKDKSLMPTLNTWISKAKAGGYNYTQMATLLEINGWDKRLVEKALKENGIVKPEFYF